MWIKHFFISSVFAAGCMGILGACLEGRAVAPPPSLAAQFWRPGFRTPQGFIVSKNLYSTRTELDYYANCSIYIMKVLITRKSAAKAPVQEYERQVSPINDQHHGPLRWRIHGDRFWMDLAGATVFKTSFIVMYLDELKYDISPKGMELSLELMKKDPAASERLLSPIWSLQPVDALIIALTTAEAKRRYDDEGFLIWIPVVGVNYDVLPISDKEGLLFVLHKKRMRVWHGHFTGTNSQPQGGNVKWTERKAEGFAATLDEPFQVYGDHTAWHFLTRSGSLYACRKPAKGPRKLEVLYSSRERPLQALITDAESNKTFAFSAAPASRKGEYFQLSDGPKAAKGYTLPDPKLDAALSEPLRSLMSFTRILVTDGKVRLPVKKVEKKR